MAPRPSQADQAAEGLIAPRVGRIRSIEVPAPRHGIGRAEAGPLLLLGLVGTLQAVEDSPAALGRWLGVSARTARTWRDQAKLERDPFGGPVLAARDGYLVRGPGFDDWLDARKPHNVGRLRSCSLPVASLRRPGWSPVARLVAALIRTEALGKPRTFLPSDRRRGDELGVNRDTITKARELLTASGASSFEVVRVGRRGYRRHRQKLLEPTAMLVSGKVSARRAARSERLRLAAPPTPERGNEPATERGNEPANTCHREPKGSSTPSKAAPRGMAPSSAPLLDGLGTRTATAAPPADARRTSDAGNPESRSDQPRDAGDILRDLTFRTRADRTELADKKTRGDSAFRTAVTSGRLEDWLARNQAGLDAFHGPALVRRLVTIADRLLLELGVFDRSKKTRQTLARLLIERGADPRDIVNAARRAAEYGKGSPRGLLTHRLRQFTSTGDRSWLAGPARKKPAPAAPAAPPRSTPRPPATDYGADADQAVLELLTSMGAFRNA